MMICLLFEDMLIEFGCEVIGPACDIRRAVDLAQNHESIDVAILGVNLGRHVVFPVADILAGRGVPIVFASGFGASGLPAPWQGSPCVPKPMTTAQLVSSLGSALREHRQG